MTVDGFLEALGGVIVAGLGAALLAGDLVPRRARAGDQVIDSQPGPDFELPMTMGVDYLPHLDPQPVDASVDKTGAATPAWDCRKRGHVVCMGSAYCLECKELIG